MTLVLSDTRRDIEVLEKAWIALAEYGERQELIVDSVTIVRGMVTDDAETYKRVSGIIEALDFIHDEIEQNQRRLFRLEHNQTPFTTTPQPNLSELKNVVRGDVMDKQEE